MTRHKVERWDNRRYIERPGGIVKATRRKPVVFPDQRKRPQRLAGGLPA
ncbi:MAG: hypothetical protein ACYTDV_18595 [Planctomycetota bacterium]